MNKVIEIGRLVRDPETRYGGANNTAITTFTIAVDRKYKAEGRPTADFIRCKAFGGTAEFIEKYFRKGMKIGIEGRITTDSYNNKEGQMVYTTEVTVETAEFVESKNSQSNTDNEPMPTPDENGFMSIPEGLEEELPFA